MDDEEQALLDRARTGDREAFARLATLHRDAVFRAAWAVLGDQEDALDATQDALLRAFRGLPGFDGRASFRTWARRIATNVAIDRVNRRGRDRSRGLGGDGLPEDEAVADPKAATVGTDLEREEERRLVRAAIEALPQAQRAAVLLRDVEGLSYEEIAAELGIPRGTVMSRLYYGRQTLKETLADALGPRAAELRRARATETTLVRKGSSP